MDTNIQAEVGAVLSKDMENIAAKVTAGKTLTSSEREFFMSQQPAVKDDNKLTTKGTLANALGVNRATLHKWWSLPDAPTKKANGGYDLEAWREFAKRNDLKDFADQDEEGQTLAERKRYYETLILKVKYQTLIGELIPVAVVEKLITDKAIEIKKVITNSALTDDEKDRVLSELHDLGQHKFRP